MEDLKKRKKENIKRPLANLQAVFKTDAFSVCVFSRFTFTQEQQRRNRV